MIWSSSDKCTPRITSDDTLCVPFHSQMGLVSELVDNVTASEWAIQGLPVDPLSMQNGIITTKATRCVRAIHAHVVHMSVCFVV